MPNTIEITPAHVTVTENLNVSMSLDNAGSGGGLVNSVDGKIGDVEVLPTGGTTGQVLKKASATDYDVEWANESGGGGGAVSSVNGKTGAVVLTASDVGAGTYSKPSGGIPKTDLASAVQTSLGKADTALQTAPVASVNGQTGAVTLVIPSTAADVGAIAAPSSPATGAFLVWNGSAWVAQTLSTWQGGAY